jgi:hypothetical protein
MLRIERLVAAVPLAKNVVPEGLGGSAKRFAVSVLARRGQLPRDVTVTRM